MPVSSILAYLSSGMSIDELLEEFEFLEKEDIFDAMGFCALIVEDKFISLESAS